MVDYMITTVDNPFNPFLDFDEWYVFDQSHGYNTLSVLGRVIVTSDELSEADQDLAYMQAVDEIVQENVIGMWRKIPNPEMAISE